jgi:hypothetical protein
MSNDRMKYTATISRINRDNANVCVMNIIDVNGVKFQDHSWLNREDAGVQIWTLREFNRFDKVEFTAVLYEYDRDDGTSGIGLGDIKGVKRL